VFVAVTVNVYDIPVVRPDTMIGEDDPVAVCPPEDVTVYSVIEDPPVAPAVNGTEIDVAVFCNGVPIVGACGTVVAVTPDEADEAEDVPYALDAVTVYVYCVLDASPVTVTGDDVPVNVDGDVVGVGVTTNELGAPALVLGVNATDILPLLNARPDG
jgi:hypothetical protein